MARTGRRSATGPSRQRPTHEAALGATLRSAPRRPCRVCRLPDHRAGGAARPGPHRELRPLRGPACDDDAGPPRPPVPPRREPESGARSGRMVTPAGAAGERTTPSIAPAVGDAGDAHRCRPVRRACRPPACEPPCERLRRGRLDLVQDPCGHRLRTGERSSPRFGDHSQPRRSRDRRGWRPRRPRSRDRRAALSPGGTARNRCSRKWSPGSAERRGQEVTGTDGVRPGAGAGGFLDRRERPHPIMRERLRAFCRLRATCATGPDSRARRSGQRGECRAAREQEERT